MELRNVSCGYRGKPVLSGFSAAASSGGILCLLGPNGVGKTTLFKCMLGLLPALEGSVTLDGKDIRRYGTAEFARAVGYVPQAHTPPFAFRALDVVTMGRTAHLGLSGRLREADLLVAAGCMERLGISSLAERIYTELSGGERQMVLIARALAQEPAFLMMDEPASSLDFGNQARLLRQVRALAEAGLGVIMATHHPDHVFCLEAQVALLLRGNEYLLGSAEQVITEENMRRAYGIDVAVVTARGRGRQLRLCTPMMEEDGG